MKNLQISIFLLIILVIISLGYLLISKNKPPMENLVCKDCNIIVIGIDTLRADHISSYGYFRTTTPYIDEFSHRSFVFKNAISASSWTLPSFMSIFTSTYPSDHGIKNVRMKNEQGESVLVNLKQLNPGIITLAETLKQNNYQTAAFVGGGSLEGKFGFDNGFDVYKETGNFTGFELSIPDSLKWLSVQKNKKFFLFIHGYDVHGRYLTKKNYSGNFTDKNYNGVYTGQREEEIRLANLSLEQGYVNLSEEDKEFWISLYDSKLYDADKRVGTFLSEIEKLGLLDNTIIILLSDHGEELFERNRIDHGFSLYDELIHVPLIIYVPHSKENNFIDGQVRTIDVMPTIFELTDIKLNNSVQAQIKGQSLVPFMQGKFINLDAFSETDYLYKVYKKSLRKASSWKYIYPIDTSENELYHLKKDPKERNNLIEEENRLDYELEQELFNYMYKD